MKFKENVRNIKNYKNETKRNLKNNVAESGRN